MNTPKPRWQMWSPTYGLSFIWHVCYYGLGGIIGGKGFPILWSHIPSPRWSIKSAIIELSSRNIPYNLASVIFRAKSSFYGGVRANSSKTYIRILAPKTQYTHIYIYIYRERERHYMKHGACITYCVAVCGI